MLAGQSDLKFVMADNKVAGDIQAVLYHTGFSSLGAFCSLDIDEAGVRNCLATQFGLAATADVASRLRGANVCNAWAASQKIRARTQEAMAESKVSGFMKPVSVTDHAAMRKAVEAKFGETPFSRRLVEQVEGSRGQRVGSRASQRDLVARRSGRGTAHLDSRCFDRNNPGTAFEQNWEKQSTAHFSVPAWQRFSCSRGAEVALWVGKNPPRHQRDL